MDRYGKELQTKALFDNVSDKQMKVFCRNYSAVMQDVPLGKETKDRMWDGLSKCDALQYLALHFKIVQYSRDAVFDEQSILSKTSSSALLRHIASFLSLRDYIHFGRCCGSLFSIYNYKPCLQELNLCGRDTDYIQRVPNGFCKAIEKLFIDAKDLRQVSKIFQSVRKLVVQLTLASYAQLPTYRLFFIQSGCDP